MFAFHNNFDDFFTPSFTRNRRALPGGNSKDSLVPFNDFFNEPMIFRENFYNPRENVKLKEDDDKYIVYFEDKRIKQKELKVDYLKKQNQLRLSIMEKSGDNEKFQYTSSYQSSLGFDKPVKYDEIKANVDDNKVEIVIPKVESDDSNTVSIKVNGSNVKPLIESSPQDNISN